MNTTLTISVDESGRVSVSGPINNGIIAYGILELGRQAIAAHLRDGQQQVQLATPGMFPPGGKN